MKREKRRIIPVSVKLMGNGFVDALFGVYDKAYMPEEEDFEWYYKEGNGYYDEKPIWYFFRPMEKIQVNKGLEEAYEHAMNTLIKDPNDLQIGIIEDFCDFVRVAEKVAFYHNDMDNFVIVDSKVEDSTKRLVIKNDQFQITIQTYSSRILEEGINDTIAIGVERLYGKQMNNSFVVVDRKIQYNDDSDMYLMNTINLILMNTINQVLKEVYDLIKEKKIKGTY